MKTKTKDCIFQSIAYPRSDTIFTINVGGGIVLSGIVLKTRNFVSKFNLCEFLLHSQQGKSGLWQ